MPEGKGWGASQSPPTASPALDVSAQGGRASGASWGILAHGRGMSGTCLVRLGAAGSFLSQ